MNLPFNRIKWFPKQPWPTKTLLLFKYAVHFSESIFFFLTSGSEAFVCSCTITCEFLFWDFLSDCLWLPLLFQNSEFFSKSIEQSSVGAYIYIFAVLGIEHSASQVLGGCSTTELHTQTWSYQVQSRTCYQSAQGLKTHTLKSATHCYPFGNS